MESSSEATTQVEYGKRLLPALVDECARTNPDYVFAMVPKTSNLADGYKEITIKSFARAVNEVAHRIDSTAGKSTKFDTIAYIGPSQSPLHGNIRTPPLMFRSGPQVFCHCSWCCQNGLQG